MKRTEWEVTATNKANPAASFTAWDVTPDRAVARVIEWETPARIGDYYVTVHHIPSGVATTYNGEDYLVDGGEDAGVPCVDCGGPCNGADSVADDSGLAWCGSFYGNGCADRNGGQA